MVFRRRLLSGLDWFFADLFFDFTPPFVRQPRSQKSVEQISQKKHRRHPFVIHDREDEDKTDDKKTRNRFFRFPVKCLKARILETTEHHKGQQKHERRQNEFPVPEVMFAFGQPEQKKCDGCNETRRSRNGKPGEISVALSIGRFVIGRRGIEARQTQRTAREIDKRYNPASARKVLKNDPINHQSWRNAERNNVGQRIEFATKHALMSTEACEPTIQQVEKTS